MKKAGGRRLPPARLSLGSDNPLASRGSFLHDMRNHVKQKTVKVERDIEHEEVWIMKKAYEVYFDAILPCTMTVKAHSKQAALAKVESMFHNGDLADLVAEAYDLSCSDEGTMDAHISNVVESDDEADS